MPSFHRQITCQRYKLLFYTVIYPAINTSNTIFREKVLQKNYTVKPLAKKYRHKEKLVVNIKV